MNTRTDLEHAAELLARLIPQATSAPWIDQTAEHNRYSALVSATCTRRCDDYVASLASRYAPDSVPEWMKHHPHEGYGGCLVAESMIAPDRRLLAVMRNAADHLPKLLEAIAHEDVTAIGHHARQLATAITDTHRPTNPTGAAA